MKKIILILSAILIVSITTIVGYKAYNQSQILDLMQANIEALSNDECTPTLSAICENTISLTCYYVCKKCKHKWENRFTKFGKTIIVTGRCSCGEFAMPPYI